MARLAYSAKSTLAVICVLFSILPWLATCTCFYPNGDTATDRIPCNPNGSASVCCADNFMCLSNGLCVDPRYENYQRVLRSGCTEKSGGGPCPAFCNDLWPQGDQAVYYCGEGKYCCSNAECCSEKKGLLDLGEPQVIGTAGVEGSFVTPTLSKAASNPTSKATEQSAPQQTTQPEQSQGQQPPPSQPPATVTVSQSPAPGPATSNASAPISSKKTTNTTAIGAGIGVGIGLLFVCSIIAAFIFLRRRRKNNRAELEAREMPRERNDAESGANKKKRKGPYGGVEDLVELEADLKLAELPCERDAGELDGRTSRFAEG
ncbi:hypothetical protein GQ43DRAFT_473879 [Delitschia confertaspora ATCC 74209]|uniref:LPXTG-motif cell wall anchor domain protein n=1 Tax=Delitschia confertaspora ATCC 74209 TaxID=1513339 RepID=A0A9P4JGS8_9PLEO|nr:hypothetical protein GQ43DRAFT_473879 [Delitschia confertaspora ATCC 74209]